jgi:hypothetical protein
VGLQRLFLQAERRRLSDEHFPLAQKSIWDFHGLYTVAATFPASTSPA